MHCKIPALGKSLGPRGVYFPIPSRQCTDSIPDICNTWHVHYLTSGVGCPSAIRCANGINILPGCAVKPITKKTLKPECFNQLANLSFLILCLSFFLGYFLLPATAMEKASGTITGDPGANPGDLLLHSGFVLHTTRDVRPCSVVLVAMLDYYYAASWSVKCAASLSSLVVALVVCIHLNLSGYGHHSNHLCHNFVKSVLEMHRNKCFKSKQCNYCDFKNLHRRHVSVVRSWCSR